jgi:hypothetical protein
MHCDKCRTVTIETQFMKTEMTKNNLDHFSLIMYELATCLMNPLQIKESSCIN